MSHSHLQDLRGRLTSGKLSAEDIRYLDGLLGKAEADGLGEQIGGKRVVARLPYGMDIVK